MWVLSTTRAELHYFVGPIAVPGGYAILSHTWGDHEQTFQEIQAIAKRCKAEGTNPRDHVSYKIRGCCILAEHHGYAWAWVDSSCIDSTNPAELSESINSMFLWYSQAEICYVYLADVPSDCGALDAPDSPFRRSRWHTRGWTLQELIAPGTVIFLSKDWSWLGCREDPRLAPLLQDVTKIPAALLMRLTDVYDYSVATRMFWASERHTTRIEDEAYCLMGILDVNMPTIYGEGKRAFQRLQLEIMKDSSDASLFAWGTCLHPQGILGDLTFQYRPPAALNYLNYLLAPSPRSFLQPVDFTPLLKNHSRPYPPPRDGSGHTAQELTGPFDRIELPRFATTNYGTECRFPIIEGGGYRIIVLLCEADGDHLGLLLREDTKAMDLTRPRYYTGAAFRYDDAAGRHWKGHRMVALGRDIYNLRFNRCTVTATWQTIYVVSSPVNRASPNASFSRLRLGTDVNPAFRIPHWLIATLTALDFSASHRQTDGDSSITHRIQLRRAVHGVEWITIDLGLCTRFESDASQPTSERASEPQCPAPWARAFLHNSRVAVPPLSASAHDCHEDHIDAWPMRTKLIHDSGSSDGERCLRISFLTSGVSPQATLDVHLELLGSAYEAMLRSAGVTIPTRETLDLLSGRPQMPISDAPLPPGVNGYLFAMPPMSSFEPPVPSGPSQKVENSPFWSRLWGLWEHNQREEVRGGVHSAVITSHVHEVVDAEVSMSSFTPRTIPGAFPERDTE